MLVIAHLSDLHLDGTAAARQRVDRVADHLRAQRAPVDVVLVTGDVADSGTAEQYREARAALDLPYPTLLLPGNHDDGDAFRHAFGPPAATAGAPVDRAERVGGALFALCDSTRPGRDDGALSAATVSWLDGVLAAAPDLPTFLCLHHPPVDLHLPLLDSIRLSGEDELARLLDRHPQVVAVLCGHAHTAAAARFAGRPVLVAPAVASTVRLPWEPGPEVDLAAPPALAYHVLTDDRQLTTHVRVVD